MLARNAEIDLGLIVRKLEKRVPDAKVIVTVHAVRTANGKLMTASKGSTPPPPPPTPRVASVLRDVASAGQRAMQSAKKP